jgi:hypothetical protein
MVTSRSFTEQDEKVLKLLENVREKVSAIAEPVDPHKRFNRDDIEDRYGLVISWFHLSGWLLFRDK